jgi:hypothetical protein
MMNGGFRDGSESVKFIAARAGRHAWATVVGAIDALGWSNLTTFGPRTMTQGGALQPPDWAVAIDGMIHGDASDGAVATGGITARKLATGIDPLPQWMLCTKFAQQTTSGESALAPPLEMNPMLKVIGAIQIQGSPGAVDLGSADAQTSFRFSDQAYPQRLRWLAATIVETDATDLLAIAPTSVGGDVVFPFTVTKAYAGIRAAGVDQTSDLAVAGGTIGQARLEGSALIDNNQDLGGGGVVGEAAATSMDADSFHFWDESIGLQPGQLDWLVGYTGTDSGTEVNGAELALQMP